MEEEYEIDLKEFFSIIKKRKKYVIIITLLTIIIVYILSSFIIPPTYEAKTSIIIGREQSTNNNDEQTNNDVMMYQNLIKTYSEIAKSDVVAVNAANKLNNKVPVEKIKKKLTVTPEQGTQIIYMVVKGKTAEEAYNMSTALSDAFIEEARTRMTLGSVQILDKATLPKKPVKPRKGLNLVISFILGLLGSIGIVFIIEHLDDTIKNENDIERYIEIPVIGVIPDFTEE